ncbi:DUF1534 domain-containing protein [Pseudomonas caricapapayae]|nr:DUF1534 domain-containing protein [Pseudomonas caricapapayae]
MYAAASRSRADAERPERHATQSVARWLRLSFRTLQRRNAVRDAPRHRSALRHHTQDRTQSVQNGMQRRASHDS